MSLFRARVLAALRNVHRAKREVFNGDDHAMKVTTNKIREEFRKNMTLSDPTKLEEAITIANDAAMLLRTTVVQLRQKNQDTFELRLTKNTALPKNTPYDPSKEIPLRHRGKNCSEAGSYSDS
ncbi:complex III assembly factor LYRM7-like [Physella acuta]|uniref:complex III assembly factor LYRM7-like n=1 Tax=Physella acuta TaxID=109671 RepID=UPI0027DAC1FC|nr:complex III assembly factor LYRM7-like [Physella acuta]